VQSDSLLGVATDHVVRARLLAARSPGSGDWREALPLSSVGLKMENETIRIAAGYRLGAPIVRPHVCVCGATVAVGQNHLYSNFFMVFLKDPSLVLYSSSKLIYHSSQYCLI